VPGGTRDGQCRQDSHRHHREFDSGGIAANGSWSYVAQRSGVYAYGGTFHPTMKGKIMVK
jgi:plastocyanin